MTFLKNPQQFCQSRDCATITIEQKGASNENELIKKKGKTAES